MKADLPEVLRPVLPEQGLHVVIVGCGGIGIHVVRGLLTLFRSMPAGRVRMVLVDGDEWEASNGARCLLDVEPGVNKAKSLVARLMPYVQGSGVTLVAVDSYLTPQNIANIIRPNSLCCLCVDNHRSRKLVSDFAYGVDPDGSRGAGLSDVVLVCAGNDGIEKTADGLQLRGTYGTVAVAIRQGRDGEGKGWETPPLTRWPEIENPQDHLPGDASCAELLASKSAPQLAFTNFSVAAAMLNTCFLLLSPHGQRSALHYSFLCVDIAEGRMAPVLPLSLHSPGATPTAAGRSPSQ